MTFEASERRAYAGRIRAVLVPFVLVLAMMLAVTGCGSSGAPHSDRQLSVRTGMRFVAAPRWVLAECAAAAQAVGYPVPCPMKVPTVLIRADVAGANGCRISLISRGCGPDWKGWVVGTSESASPSEHLVLTASPQPILNPAKVVNGPAWYPGARVKNVGSLAINGWQVEAFFAPQATNDGSAFAQHVVLIWTVGGHTYGVGFHNVSSVRQTLLRDEALLCHLKLVGP
jgi:hypothetical protein